MDEQALNEHAIIKNEAQLEALYGKPKPASLGKEVDHLSPVYQAWLDRSAFLTIASIGEGGMDCSPRGDKVGQLFRVLNKQTIAIPDRRGNNRLDTLRNIVNDSRVALLFLIPGINDSLRVNGNAVLSTDQALCESFSVNGKPVVSVLVVSINAVYFQCARAMVRSELWKETSKVNANDVPSAGDMIKSGMNEFDATTYDANQEQRIQDTLY